MTSWPSAARSRLNSARTLSVSSATRTRLRRTGWVGSLTLCSYPSRHHGGPRDVRTIGPKLPSFMGPGGKAGWVRGSGPPAPDFFEAIVPSAAPSVVPVLDGMGIVVVLVIGLGPEKRPGGSNLHDDRLRESLLDSLFRGLGRPALGLVMDENLRPVLVPHIAELPVGGKRVDVTP